MSHSVRREQKEKRARKKGRERERGKERVNQQLLGKPANIKVENNGAVVYVRSSLTVKNSLFSFPIVTE